MKINGFDLISEERLRQKTEEGWTSAHDERHENGELALAADCYREIGMIQNGKPLPNDDQSAVEQPTKWPWSRQWWKPKTRLRNLVRAGALYQAEIDRLCSQRMVITQEIDALLLNEPEAGSGDLGATEAQSGVST